jgi:hydrogenase maturation protein HypF
VARGYLALAPERAPAFARAFAGVDPQELAVADQQIAHRLNAPLASSMGRLFDAAAAILGVRTAARYEGQAAMELESLASDLPSEGAPLPFPALERDGLWELDPIPLLAGLGEAAARGDDPATLAATFHESVAAGSADLAFRAAETAGVTDVVLAGGCFQNARLLTSLRRRLVERGLRVLLPRLLSPNDGAISYGQAAVATALLRREADGGV